MNEVDLHNFIGRCPCDTLESIFPSSGKRKITAEQIKEAIVFEESAGHEETIMLFYRYLLQLEKYEAGMMNSTSLWRGILCRVHVSSQEKKLKKNKILRIPNK